MRIGFYTIFAIRWISISIIVPSLCELFEKGNSNSSTVTTLTKNHSSGLFGGALPSPTTHFTITVNNKKSTAKIIINENATGYQNTSSGFLYPRAKAATTFSLDDNVSISEKASSTGIRLRLNEPFFEETARFFYAVFNYEVQNIRIQQQRQCFQEGCFHSHTFRITGFQRPAGITLKPTAPNLLVLNIISFDVDRFSILGLLNGNVQLLLTSVPVTGQLIVSARQLLLSAVFNLQKTQNRTPFLRMERCELLSGYINTRVSDVGLLTDTINLKYKTEMIAKSKEMITSTVCEKIDEIIKMQINVRLRQMPRVLAVSQILKVLATISSKSSENTVASNPSFIADENKLNRKKTSGNNKPFLFDYVHPRGRPYVYFRNKRRRKREATSANQLRPTVKVALQDVGKIMQRSHLRYPSALSLNEPSIVIEKDHKDVATVREIIPEEEEEEQENQTTESQQTLQNGENIQRDNSNGNAFVTLVESTRLRDQQKQNVLNNNNTNRLSNVDNHTTVVNGDSRRIHESAKTLQELEDKKQSKSAQRPKSQKSANFSIQNFTKSPAMSPTEASAVSNIHSAAFSSDNNRTANLTNLLAFLDMNALGRIFLDLDFVDSSASADSFSVGINGDVILKTPQPVSFEKVIQEFPTVIRKSSSSPSTPMLKIAESLRRSEKQEQLNRNSEKETNEDLLSEFEAEHGSFKPLHLRFPVQNQSRKTLEIAVSEYTPNLLLLQAHRARLLKVHVGPNAPLFGNLLKTTCSEDEICLSDSVPEIGEKFPNRHIEIIIETVRAPKILISKDVATLHFVGAATFYLASSRKAIGRIPFIGAAEIRCGMSATVEHRLELSLKMIKLEILEDLDFFNLPAETLGGLRDAVKGALENAARQMLAGGIDTRPFASFFQRYGIGELAFHLTDSGILLLQADVDVYRFAFEQSSDESEAAA